jgi:hypothetical protein
MKALADKFYTKPDVVNKCIEILKNKVAIDRSNDVVIEPSAGGGAFLDALAGLCDMCIFLDLIPEHEGVTEGDFLVFTNPHPGKRTHVIGNPPFGRQSSLAIKFIRHAATFCDTISFILPKSFKKDSMKDKVPNNFHLINETDLDSESFTVEGKSYDVPCTFQIWEKRDHDRASRVKVEPKGYAFVKKSESPDVSIRRVGVNAGEVDKEISTKSEQSHYFIKFNGEIPDRLNELKSRVQAFATNTVGPKSVSKQELVGFLNELSSPSGVNL